MKRTNPNKVQPVDACEIHNEFAGEPSKQATAGTSRARTSAAAIGLAISMGTLSSVLPKVGDSAVATEPPATAEPTATLQPAPVNGTGNSLNVEDQAATPAAAPGIPMGVKGQKGLLWEPSRESEANGSRVQSDAIGSVLKIPSVESMRSEVQGGNNVATLPARKRYVEAEPGLGTTQLAPLAAPASTQPAISDPRNLGVASPTGEQLPSEANGGINRWKKPENSLKKPLVVESASRLESATAARREQSPTEAKAAEPGLLPVVPTDKFDVFGHELAARPLPTLVVEPGNPQGTPSATGVVVIEPSPALPAQAAKFYSVRDGDTLDAIARMNGISVAQLIEMNQISDPHFLKVNQPLKIPQIALHSSSDESGFSRTGSNLVGTVATTGETMTPENQGVSDSTPTVPTRANSVEGTGSVTRSATGQFNSTPLTPFVPGANKASATFPAQPAVVSAVGQDGAIAAVNLPGIGLTAAIGNSEAPSVNLISDRATANKVLTQPAPFASEPDIKAKAVQPAHAPNPYAERLRAEIVRLREEYRADRSGANGTVANLVAEQPPADAVDFIPSERTQPINPDFNPNRSMQAIQDEISPPQARQWAQQMQRPRPENSPAVNAAVPAEAAPNSATRQPLIATAPLGSDAYDPLSNPSLGRMVSPELPPLPDADAYLPSGSIRSNGLIWPAKGVMTSGFGWRWGRMHKGIDIANDIGTPIFAAADGVVTYAGWNDGGYGYLVEITHANGSQTLYGHNSRIVVQEGQKVTQGQQISEMGSTGFSTGPHLHFEIHPGGQGAVNPLAFLPSDDSTAYR